MEYSVKIFFQNSTAFSKPGSSGKWSSVPGWVWGCAFPGANATQKTRSKRSHRAVYFIVTSFESRIEQPTCHELGIHKAQIVNNFNARNNRIPVVWLTNLATIDHGQNARVIDGKPPTHYSLRHLFDEL